MPPISLPNGEDAYKKIQSYLESTNFWSFTLSIYDILSKKTAEISCKFDDFVDVIRLVAETEESAPEWIGANAALESYVVGIRFVRGLTDVSANYKYKDGILEVDRP